MPFPPLLISKFNIDMAERNGVDLRRVLRSADFFSDLAIASPDDCVKIPFLRSMASLTFITCADHCLRVFITPAFLDCLFAFFCGRATFDFAFLLERPASAALPKLISLIRPTFNRSASLGCDAANSESVSQGGQTQYRSLGRFESPFLTDFIVRHGVYAGVPLKFRSTPSGIHHSNHHW